MMLAAVNPYSTSSSNTHFQIQDVTDDPEYSSYGNENEAPPEEGALVEYCRLDKRDQSTIPRICEASTVVSAKLRNPPLIPKSTTVSYNTAKVWFRKFKNEVICLEDLAWSARPVAVSDERLLKLVQGDPRRCTREVAGELECSHITIAQHQRGLGKT
ncbi:unnamed protein product [Heligmosomoides polygyrus]|uniref:HTH_48 domain-containing protein n=1 Tax=Heligmosomoides polygyrus TaxID=6339 RepID=A0A183FLX6_HELPZ|nr:unnamed protein product [Heligmosomoides polygyrus]